MRNLCCSFLAIGSRVENLGLLIVICCLKYSPSKLPHGQVYLLNRCTDFTVRLDSSVIEAIKTRFSLQ